MPACACRQAHAPRPPDERRGELRGKTYLRGQVVFNDRYSTSDCLVRNMARNGAKLVFAHPPIIPSAFDLIIPRKGDSRRARVIWRSELEACVAFESAVAANVVSIETARRLRRLEEERDALARRVSELSEPV